MHNMFINELGIEIKETRYTYPVHRNSIFLARHIAEGGFKRVLEIGTGTGVIAVYLAKNGAQVTATDVYERVIGHAQENARLNSVRIQLVCSDLYTHVKGEYDCIVFLTPYFPFRSFSTLAFLLEKSLPYFLETRISYLLDRALLNGRFSKPRRMLIQKFLMKVPTYLSKDGSVFLSVFKSDIPFLKKFRFLRFKRIYLPFFSDIVVFKIQFPLNLPNV
ncbi:MAG TPA: methyltransferase [Candidatus Nanoarchaeia archaeon]|nr:methyltransferase [Candidatus Nanoarchaeia archaeon]